MEKSALDVTVVIQRRLSIMSGFDVHPWEPLTYLIFNRKGIGRLAQRHAEKLTSNSPISSSPCGNSGKIKRKWVSLGWEEIYEFN